LRNIFAKFRVLDPASKTTDDVSREFLSKAQYDVHIPALTALFPVIAAKGAKVNVPVLRNSLALKMYKRKLSLLDYLSYLYYKFLTIVNKKFKGDENYIYDDATLSYRSAFEHAIAILLRAFKDVMKGVLSQEEGKRLLDDFCIQSREYEKGYYTADSLEAISTICSKAIKAGTKVFNLVGVEDVMNMEYIEWVKKINKSYEAADSKMSSGWPKISIVNMIRILIDQINIVIGEVISLPL